MDELVLRLRALRLRGLRERRPGGGGEAGRALGEGDAEEDDAEAVAEGGVLMASQIPVGS